MHIGNSNRGIGGYLEMSFGVPGVELHPGALAFQSGRAAFLALLRAGRPARVWLPWYICSSMVDQVDEAGIEVVRYALSDRFTVESGVSLQDRDWLVFVNYFGLCDSQVEDALSRFPAQQVIIDNSLAFHSAHRPCLGTIYSPRKFVGVPDGGYLVTGVAVPLPDEEDTASAMRCIPLLRRASEGAESGFRAWQEVQRAFAGQAPMQMSRLTRLLLISVDYSAAAARRQRNYDVLAKELDSANSLGLVRTADAVPLAYPFYAKLPGLRSWLIARRVYVPQLWPHLFDELTRLPSFERSLVEDCVPLPCDQRYGREEMTFIAGLVKEHIGHST